MKGESQSRIRGLRTIMIACKRYRQFPKWSKSAWRIIEWPKCNKILPSSSKCNVPTASCRSRERMPMRRTSSLRSSSRSQNKCEMITCRNRSRRKCKTGSNSRCTNPSREKDSWVSWRRKRDTWLRASRNQRICLIARLQRLRSMCQRAKITSRAFPHDLVFMERVFLGCMKEASCPWSGTLFPICCAELK